MVAPSAVFKLTSNSSGRSWCTLIKRIRRYLTVDQPPALQDLPGSCRRLCRRNFLGHEQLGTEIRRACHCLLQSGQRVPATLFDERDPLPFTGLFEGSQLGVHGPRTYGIWCRPSWFTRTIVASSARGDAKAAPCCTSLAFRVTQSATRGSALPLFNVYYLTSEFRGCRRIGSTFAAESKCNR